MKTTPSRLTILKTIGDHFQGVIQWSRHHDADWAENVVQYLHQAEALIELLEVFDCGSIGGFDSFQPPPRTLFDRWDWLFRKYDKPDGLRFGCNIVSYEEVRDYFANVRCDVTASLR